MSGETTIVRPSRNKRRQLKTKRLPAAGRQEGKNIATSECVAHNLLLQRPKSRVAEVFLEGGEEIHVLIFPVSVPHLPAGQKTEAIADWTRNSDLALLVILIGE